MFESEEIWKIFWIAARIRLSKIFNFWQITSELDQWARLCWFSGGWWWSFQFPYLADFQHISDWIWCKSVCWRVSSISRHVWRIIVSTAGKFNYFIFHPANFNPLFSKLILIHLPLKLIGFSFYDSLRLQWNFIFIGFYFPLLLA